jgi:hypothetical protein
VLLKLRWTALRPSSPRFLAPNLKIDRWQSSTFTALHYIQQHHRYYILSASGASDTLLDSFALLTCSALKWSIHCLFERLTVCRLWLSWKQISVLSNLAAMSDALLSLLHQAFIRVC